MKALLAAIALFGFSCEKSDEPIETYCGVTFDYRSDGYWYRADGSVCGWSEEEDSEIWYFKVWEVK